MCAAARAALLLPPAAAAAAAADRKFSSVGRGPGLQRRFRSHANRCSAALTSRRLCMSCVLPVLAAVGLRRVRK